MMKLFTNKIVLILAALLLACSFFGTVTAAQKEPVKVMSREIKLAGELQAKLVAVQKREKSLTQKEVELAKIGKEVDAKLGSLLDLQEDLKKKLAELKVIKGKRFKNLVKIYSAMSASKLAPLLNQMEDDTVSEILRAMKAAEVAKIMPKLDQQKAVRVSKLLGMI